MLEWETTGSPTPGDRDDFQKARPPKPVDPGSPPEELWEDWQRRIWHTLGRAAVPYAIGHLLFALDGHLPRFLSASLNLQIGAVLFLVGAILLWRVNRMLDGPRDLPQASTRLLEAWCLVISLILSLSPCLWWLLHRW
jgi:hypothetical protein